MKEGDLVTQIPDLLMADDINSLDKFELATKYGIEQVFVVRCHTLTNHDRDYDMVNDDSM